ncbi:MAG: hypothetical protein GEV11_13525 [Streptosporangiales bacterium]|nr:hypothetical protein [Streptosporangiales bacterium]
MKHSPTCPRCGGPVRAPDAWSSAWRCTLHADVHPLHPPREPAADALEVLLRDARVPVWLPWPLLPGWVVTGFTGAGDQRTGLRASAVALSGPAPLGGGGDLVTVAEEPGVGLGARYAGLDGPDPGEGFNTGPPHVRIEFQGHDVPMWAVQTDEDRAVYVGEAMGLWAWTVIWPAGAGVLMYERMTMRDLTQREIGAVPPFGALSPRL